MSIKGLADTVHWLFDDTLHCISGIYNCKFFSFYFSPHCPKMNLCKIKFVKFRNNWPNILMLQQIVISFNHHRQVTSPKMVTDLNYALMGNSSTLGDAYRYHWSLIRHLVLVPSLYLKQCYLSGNIWNKESRNSNKIHQLQDIAFQTVVYKNSSFCLSLSTLIVAIREAISWN